MHQLYLCFTLNDQRFALPVEVVDRAIRAVAVTPVPASSGLLYGLINFYSQIIPVVNLRERFSMNTKAIEPDDRFLIVKTEEKLIAVVVDRVEELISVGGEELSSFEEADSAPVADGAKALGLAQLQYCSDQQGIIVIYDLMKLLGDETVIEIKNFFATGAQPEINGK